MSAAILIYLIGLMSGGGTIEPPDDSEGGMLTGRGYESKGESYYMGLPGECVELRFGVPPRK
jgi:hypothetical protein